MGTEAGEAETTSDCPLLPLVGGEGPVRAMLPRVTVPESLTVTVQVPSYAYNRLLGLSILRL